MTLRPDASGTPLPALGEPPDALVVVGFRVVDGATLVTVGEDDALGRNGLPHAPGNNEAAPIMIAAVRRAKAGALTPPGVVAA